MFEHYMTYQAVDPRFTRMMGVSAILSGMVTLSMVTFAWAANKMDISKVDAPTSDYLIFQLDMDDPPPPAAAPAAAAVKADDDDSESARPSDEVPEEEPPQEESLAPPSEAPKELPKLRGGGGSSGVPGIPRGGSIGMPGSPIGVSIGDTTSLLKPRKKEAAPPPKPIQAVMAQGVFTPDPDQKRLAASKAGMFDKRSCVNRTSFCVDASGKVVDVRTKSKCYDPQVDAICRDAVKRWRFKPFIVAGAAKKTCSTVQFDLSFKE